MTDRTATLFDRGDVQAVELPASLRLAGKEARARRFGMGVLLEPAERSARAAWTDALALYSGGRNDVEVAEQDIYVSRLRPDVAEFEMADRTATLFDRGDVQAVELPASLRLAGKEARVYRFGVGVLLEPAG